jgi:hypothetical protein
VNEINTSNGNNERAKFRLFLSKITHTGYAFALHCTSKSAMVRATLFACPLFSPFCFFYLFSIHSLGYPTMYPSIQLSRFFFVTRIAHSQSPFLSLPFHFVDRKCLFLLPSPARSPFALVSPLSLSLPFEKKKERTHLPTHQPSQKSTNRTHSLPINNRNFTIFYFEKAGQTQKIEPGSCW